jgi:hypothetical protein
MSIDFTRTRERLKDFDFHRLFVEELGWSQPTTKTSADMDVGGAVFTRRQISQLAGIVVFEITAKDGTIPDAKTRAALHKLISATHHENLLIFIDENRTQSLWYWVKREGSKKYPRDHFYIKGQPGDLFLGKLSAIVFELGEFDETGNVSVIEVATRLRNALDVEHVTKKFYGEFQEQHLVFLELIKGISDDRQRRWYASVLLNRLMFIYFLQRKGFLDNGNLDYLQDKLKASVEKGRDRFYSVFLNALFFEGFAKPEDQRSAATNKLLGRIKYLNGGLFLRHQVEQENPHIAIPDKAFESLFALFQRYSWNLNDTPGGLDNEINPDVLGYIFEKYINQKSFGAYYTRPEITEYLCERTIHPLILDAINTPDVVKKNPIKGLKSRDYRSMADLLMDLDADVCRTLLFTVLPKLSLLDPACGSGAFLVAAMKTLINVYSAVIGKIKFLADGNLSSWLSTAEQEHKSLNYFIKKRIITDNLYGVDVMGEGAEIARLRLFLALVAAADSADQLEPLPNIDFNILAGNSLIGLMHVDAKDFEKHNKQGEFFKRTYSEILAEKNRLVDVYRHTATYTDDLTSLRNAIQQKRDDALIALNELLLDEFKESGIKYEQVTWDDNKGKEGRTHPRPVAMADINALEPFHWGYEFDQILSQNGGFDAIITNPPWEIFKPNSKEFFEQFSDLIAKKKMTIHEFEKAQAKLLKDPEVRAAWLEYLSGFRHVSAFYRSAPEYKNQISVLNGKKAGSDINLYKLFLERSFNLLREGGRCGIITSGGVYTDLGTKQLREMLFSQCVLDTLFGLSNERFIFENVHHAQKFSLLVFEKGGASRQFSVAFRINPREAVSADKLDYFLNSDDEHLAITVDLVRRLSPDSLSIMEFRSKKDVQIAEKMSQFPLLAQSSPNFPSVQLAREFDMTQNGASRLAAREPKPGLAPLYEGKTIWQFAHQIATPQFWVDPKKLREFLLGKHETGAIPLSSDSYRLVLRRQSASTNERTLISTIIPPGFHADNLASILVFDSQGNRLISNSQQVFLCAVLNSYVADYSIRQRVTNNLNFFFLYQLPLSGLPEGSREFKEIVSRAQRLICTTDEFDGLAKELGMPKGAAVSMESSERVSLRAQLDGLVAHLYGLSEDEFLHVLASFPLVPQSEKDAALAAYAAFAPKTADQQVLALIAAGESANLEFKSSARWNLKESRADKAMEQVVVKTVAGFLNVESGGTLLLGVDDDGKVLGLENDYKTMGKKPNRDGYENWLTTMLLGEFGKDASPLIRVSFHAIDGKDVCQLALKPSPKPMFVKDGTSEHLYIRAGNSTRLLTSREAVEYCKQRWS